MIEIIPTNTCPPDLAELLRRSAGLATFSPAVQLDISDGQFSPVSSWPYGEGQWEEIPSLAEVTSGVLYEAHLMVKEPVELGEKLAGAGVSRILGHIESFDDPLDIISAFETWKAAGAKEVGLALLLDTPTAALEPNIRDCDVVQVMSIGTLGLQGAAFDARATDRIEELHSKYRELVIEVDGGVNETNIPDLVRAGATRLSIGSAISKSPDPAESYADLKKLAESITF